MQYHEKLSRKIKGCRVPWFTKSILSPHEFDIRSIVKRIYIVAILKTFVCLNTKFPEPIMQLCDIHTVIDRGGYQRTDDEAGNNRAST